MQITWRINISAHSGYRSSPKLNDSSLSQGPPVLKLSRAFIHNFLSRRDPTDKQANKQTET